LVKLMELKQAVADYLKAKDNLELLLGKNSVITNRFDGNVSLWATNIDSLAGIDEIEIDGESGNIPWLVSGKTCGVTIRCVSYKGNIEKAGLMK
jgi:hypothetical protein